MRRVGIFLSKPFKEVLASLLRLPSSFTEIAADSMLRQRRCDVEVEAALRSIYEAAHGKQVETQIGFVTIVPPIANFLKEAPYYVLTQYGFFLEALTRLLVGTSSHKRASECFVKVMRRTGHKPQREGRPSNLRENEVFWLSKTSSQFTDHQQRTRS